jgi:transcriptional regulator with XRE-family HTH domain
MKDMEENDLKKDPDNILFGKKLRELRLINRLSQEELSVRLDMHSQTVSRYERGDMTPSLKILLKIASMFDVSMDWLTKGTSKPYTSQYIKIPCLEDPEKCWILDEQVKGLIQEGDFRAHYVNDSNLAPTITKGDIVLVDIKSTALAMDKIVLIKSRAEYLVKRVIYVSDSEVHLSSNTIPFITLPINEIIGVIHYYYRGI